MNLNRALVKSQAKELISGRVFKLFILTAVILLITNSLTIISNVADLSDSSSDDSSYSDFYNFGDENSDDSQGNGENSSGNSQNGGSSDDSGTFDFGYFDDFTGSISLGSFNLSFLSGYSSGLIWGIVLVLLPLQVALAGVFLMLIRGRDMKLGESFSYVFKNTFDRNYWHKFVMEVVANIIIALTSLLFIVPGIVFHYRYYFAAMVLADKPELSGKQAVKISIKMTDNHKSELFAMDLSFIGWFLLSIITCGIAGIYVLPYYYTTKALYYENFKIRAFSEGKLTPADFVTDEERKAEYMRQNYGNGYNYYQQQGAYYNPYGNARRNNMNQNYNNYGNPNGDPNYYNPYQSPDNTYSQNNKEQSYGSGKDSDYYNKNY